MKKTSKFLSVVLAVLMGLTIIPMTAFAAIPKVELNEVTTASVPEDDYARFIFTPTESGKYVVISDKGGDDNIDPYVEIYDDHDDLVEDGDDYKGTYNFYCVFEAEAGEDYYILLGDCCDAEVEYDFVLKKYVEITHQPTVDEPYVELNWDVEADYQWQSVSIEYGEVTDENAEGRYADDVGPATYDEEYGWSSAPYDDYEANYFMIEMVAGQEIEMVSDADVECLGIWSDDYNRDDFYDVVAGESVYFTAEGDDTYFVYTEGNIDAHLRAYTDICSYTAIDGETDSEFEAKKNDTYACKVTLEDGTVLTSDYFEVTDIVEVECEHSYSDNKDETCDLCDYNRADNCDCNCHAGGIKAFFFKLGNFFAKLFNPAKKICACGMKH